MDYTWCKSDNNVTCADYIESNPGATNCSCRVKFELSNDFPVIAIISSIWTLLLNTVDNIL